MFTHPLDQQEYERGVLARRHPEAYSALIEQEQEQRRKAAENPDALDRLIAGLRDFFAEISKGGKSLQAPLKGTSKIVPLFFDEYKIC